MNCGNLIRQARRTQRKVKVVGNFLSVVIRISLISVPSQFYFVFANLRR